MRRPGAHAGPASHCRASAHRCDRRTHHPGRRCGRRFPRQPRLPPGLMRRRAPGGGARRQRARRRACPGQPDVRTVPRSRANPRFNADALPAALAAHRIGHQHLRRLGGLRGRRKTRSVAQRLLGERGLPEPRRPHGHAGVPGGDGGAARPRPPPHPRRPVRRGGLVAPPPAHPGPFRGPRPPLRFVRQRPAPARPAALPRPPAAPHRLRATGVGSAAWPLRRPASRGRRRCRRAW